MNESELAMDVRIPEPAVSRTWDKSRLFPQAKNFSFVPLSGRQKLYIFFFLDSDRLPSISFFLPRSPLGLLLGHFSRKSFAVNLPKVMEIIILIFI